MNATATAARPEPKIPTIPKRPPALGANMLKTAAHERGHFFCTVPIGTTLEIVTTPSYWQNHTGPLGLGPGARPWARIEVVSEDGELDCELRVIKVAPGMAKVRVLNVYAKGPAAAVDDTAKGKVDDEVPALPEGYKWFHAPRGEGSGHGIRLPNGDILVRGLLTRKEAHERAIAHFTEASAAAQT